MRIASKAPTRVDLAGGTLDIWPLYLFHPGAVTINAAITRYASCVIDQHPQGDDRIKLVSRDTQLEEESRRIEGLVGLLHERALLEGRDFGLRIEPTAYEFVVYDTRQEAMEALSGSD